MPELADELLSENASQLLYNLTQSIDIQLDALSNFPQQDMPGKLINALRSMQHYKDELRRKLTDSPSDHLAILKICKSLVDRCKQIVPLSEDNNIPAEIFSRLVQLESIGRQVEQINLSEASTEEASDAESTVARIGAAIDILSGQLASAQNDSNQIRKAIKETQRISEDVEKQISMLDEKIADGIKAALKDAESINEELRQKQDDVYKLVHLVTGSSMAASYALTAEEEKKLANSMRNGSVFLMLTIVLIIGYSLLETSSQDFDWKAGVFRLAFSIALSIPAAYLARESSKHRTQQYSHLRIALDLQAITPYLASLPPADQHKLKIETAGKIFGAKETNSNMAESYPINLNEIVLALISRLERKDERKDD